MLMLVVWKKLFYVSYGFIRSILQGKRAQSLGGCSPPVTGQNWEGVWRRMMVRRTAGRWLVCLVVVAACLGGTAAVWGASIHVPANYTSIQNAINAATDGDEVVIAPGTYVERINFNGKAITVRSCDPNDPTIVQSTIIVGYADTDGEADFDDIVPVVMFVSGEDADARLLGLTITGGIDEIGAGIRCDGSSPTIQNNIITNNGLAYFVMEASAKQPESVGGGIALLHGASPLIDHNEISLNFAELGGGIFATGSTTRPTLTNNVITANTAYLGGGVYADLGAILTVEGNKFGTAPNGALVSAAASMKAKADAARQKKPAVGSAKGKAARAVASDYVRKARKPSAASVAKLKNARKFSYSGNVAVIGGAMYLYSCEVALNDNVFTSNSAIDFGGAISGYELCLDSSGNVFDRNFTDDIDDYLSLEDFGYGGAISLVYGQADFSNDRFTYNTSGGGGAIALDSGTIVVKDCLFDHNMANDPGGAIAAVGFEDEDFTASVECSTFTNNSAYDGGAIAAYSTLDEPFSPFIVKDSTFEGNTAICDSGGAVYVEDGVEMQLAKCSFENNAADFYGSAIANINALLTLEDSTLSGNLGADYCYGTVYVEGGEDDIVVPPPTGTAAKQVGDDGSVIQRNTFTRNVNYEGAGIYVDSGEVFITSNSFRENTVNGEGGAIYWYNDNDGGCISWNNFIGNSASRGGAIYIDPESCYVEIQFNTFTGNMAGTVGGLGGAIFIGSNADVKNNTFCSNSAGDKGGAIYLGPGPIQIGTTDLADGWGARIKSNSFSDNFALQGGTIYTGIFDGVVAPAAAKSDGGTIIKNNIIAFSKRGCGVWFEGEAPYFAYNNVFGNIPENYCNVEDLTDIDGNISVDPLFADRATCNLFLKSVAGRWDAATGTWVRDTVTSRSIDAGDPSSDFDDEPDENGDIINQGAQGNTRFASKSSIFAAVVFADGQDGVSRSGPYKFIFFNNVNRDSVTARMNVYQDNSLCSTSKQITSGVTWTGKNKMCFSPFEPLGAATGYRIIFGSGIKLCNGNTVPWAESFPIVTGVEPVVTALEPAAGECSAPTDSVISVNFDQSMRAASVENCFAIKPRVAGTFEWNEETSAFDFIPNAPLTAGIDYTVTIGACSRDAEGDPMLRSFCWTFHTGSFDSDSAAVAVSATAASTSAGASITVNLASAATVSASIRNVAGVEIATLAPRALDSGVSTLLWNGKSKSGTSIPAGRYMVQVTAAKADGTQANALTTLQR
jgi:predicted outer membrane repeat protein